MKLSDLIIGLAGEIDAIRPELEEHLKKLAELDHQEAAFVDAAEFYAEQVERMGEAADMVGFPGLHNVCQHVNHNIDRLKATARPERGPFIDFLQEWPELAVKYLNNLQDSSIAASLVDLLREAPAPFDEQEALKTMHNLGAFPEEMNALETADQPKRPVLASPDDVSLTLPEDTDPNLLEGFFQEAPGHAEQLVAMLSKMLTDEGDMSDLVAAKRYVHTIKGTSAIIGLAGPANIGHHFEDILDYFESNKGKVGQNIASVLIDGAHCLAQMIAFLMDADTYPEQALGVLQNILDIANIIDRGGDLDNIHLRNQTAAAAPQAAPAPAAVSKAAQQGAAMRVNMSRIDEMFRVSAEMSVHISAMENQLKTMVEMEKKLHSQQLRVKTRLFELETIVDVRSLALMSSGGTNDGDASFDPLEMEQYNELHSTTHALLEDFNDNMLVSGQLSASLGELHSLENKQQVLSRDLQHLIIGTRMAEVGSLEPRLQRNIRTTSQMTGKQARLVVKGGDTLIDSDVLSQLADPLMHLLRNAIDHGLETPDERQALGKDPVGTITLEFSARGQQVFLVCRDDGRGLDFEHIRRRAVEKKMIAEEDRLSQEEIGQLIFNSGFTTRDDVSQVSGRGVGMDVVKNWVSKMNGGVTVKADQNQGTVFTMNFASSLTTVHSLVVEASGQAFVLPSVQVQQALSRNDCEFEEEGGKLYLLYENWMYSAVYLSDLVGFERTHQDFSNTFAVLMQVQGEVWAIAVDNLLDSRELLLKPPGEYVRHLEGLVGTSILGDGSVAIHLDIPLLIANYSDTGQVRVQSPADAAASSPVTNVLVVDDSLSVRNTLQELIQDAGFSVKTARDGIEAVGLLDDFIPQVVLTDLEMPNMNGVELTSHIRNRDNTKNLPVIMITSRSQEKHRQMAMQAGVSSYFTKPYNEAELLTAIDQAVSAG
ncbi:MAG: hypothetical protein CSB24_06630 [Deltaproteobacteria bacterium]|nr:MAG: hypothetical protein CSB24_06630 [Deltaproteobacteria bacterium]